MRSACEIRIEVPVKSDLKCPEKCGDSAIYAVRLTWFEMRSSRTFLMTHGVLVRFALLEGMVQGSSTEMN